MYCRAAVVYKTDRYQPYKIHHRHRPHSVVGRLPSYASPTVSSQIREGRDGRKSGGGGCGAMCSRFRKFSVVFCSVLPAVGLAFKHDVLDAESVIAVNQTLLLYIDSLKYTCALFCSCYCKLWCSICKMLRPLINVGFRNSVDASAVLNSSCPMFF